MLNPNLRALTIAAILSLLAPFATRPVHASPELIILAQAQDARKSQADNLIRQGIQQSLVRQYQESLQSFE